MTTFERLFFTTNEIFGRGMGAYWDGKPPKPGPWQKVPGCERIVHSDIPSPLMRMPPTAAGERAIVSANGRLYDYETGKPMSVYGGGGHRPMEPNQGSAAFLEAAAKKGGK